MNKVTAKLNSNVRKALTSAKTLTTEISSFDHFSYQADWSNFPNSLVIKCHLHELPKPEDAELLAAKLSRLVQISLLKQGIKLRDHRKNIKLTTV